MMVLTDRCTCLDMTPRDHIVWTRRGDEVTEVKMKQQRTIAPKVNLEIVKLPVGDGSRRVLQYSCDWCGATLAQRALR